MSILSKFNICAYTLKQFLKDTSINVILHHDTASTLSLVRLFSKGIKNSEKNYCKPNNYNLKKKLYYYE